MRGLEKEQTCWRSVCSRKEAREREREIMLSRFLKIHHLHLPYHLSAFSKTNFPSPESFLFLSLLALGYPESTSASLTPPTSSRPGWPRTASPCQNLLLLWPERIGRAGALPVILIPSMWFIGSFLLSSTLALRNDNDHLCALHVLLLLSHIFSWLFCFFLHKNDYDFFYIRIYKHMIWIFSGSLSGER